MTRLLFMLTVMLITAPNAEGQLLKRILKNTEDKIVDSAERMVVEKASEALARAVMRSLEKKLDDLLAKEYARQDSIDKANGRTPRYRDFDDFLNAMNRADDVPPAYHFDIQQYVTVTGKSKKDKQSMTYLFSKEGDKYAFEMDDDGAQSMVVFDLKNDLMVIYRDEDGEKTAYAMSNMIPLAAGMMNDADREEEDFKLTKTGKTKTIAGYHCEEYEMMREKERTSTYTTQDLSFNSIGAYRQMFEQFLSKEEMASLDNYKGIAMEMTHYDKKGKLETHWLTEKIVEKDMEWDNSQYTFKNYSDDRE